MFDQALFQYVHEVRRGKPLLDCTCCVVAMQDKRKKKEKHVDTFIYRYRHSPIDAWCLTHRVKRLVVCVHTTVAYIYR